MSSPRKITAPVAPDDYTGIWNHDRFRQVCRELGIHDAAQLAHVINDLRRKAGDQRTIDPKVARGYFSGTQNPTRGAVGKPAAAFELARLLDVDLSWLCSGKAVKR